VAFTVNPDVMAQQSKYISYCPTLKAAIAKVPPDILVDLPTAPDNTKTSSRKINRGAISSSALSCALLLALPSLFTRVRAAIVAS
ncbi:hypothetical protein ACC685_37830, partial [Rhizobium ruizarguesonis]